MTSHKFKWHMTYYYFFPIFYTPKQSELAGLRGGKGRKMLLKPFHYPFFQLKIIPSKLLFHARRKRHEGFIVPPYPAPLIRRGWQFQIGAELRSKGRWGCCWNGCLLAVLLFRTMEQLQSRRDNDRNLMTCRLFHRTSQASSGSMKVWERWRKLHLGTWQHRQEGLERTGANAYFRYSTLHSPLLLPVKTKQFSVREVGLLPAKIRLAT